MPQFNEKCFEIVESIFKLSSENGEKESVRLLIQKLVPLLTLDQILSLSYLHPKSEEYQEALMLLEEQVISILNQEQFFDENSYQQYMIYLMWYVYFSYPPNEPLQVKN